MLPSSSDNVFSPFSYYMYYILCTIGSDKGRKASCSPHTLDDAVRKAELEKGKAWEDVSCSLLCLFLLVLTLPLGPSFVSLTSNIRFNLRVYHFMHLASPFVPYRSKRETKTRGEGERTFRHGQSTILLSLSTSLVENIHAQIPVWVSLLSFSLLFKAGRERTHLTQVLDRHKECMEMKHTQIETFRQTSIEGKKRMRMEKRTQLTILDRIFSFSDVLWVGDLDTATKVYVFGWSVYLQIEHASSYSTHLTHDRQTKRGKGREASLRCTMMTNMLRYLSLSLSGSMDNVSSRFETIIHTMAYHKA